MQTLSSGRAHRGGGISGGRGWPRGDLAASCGHAEEEASGQKEQEEGREGEG